jgi:hypothetical protein
MRMTLRVETDGVAPHRAWPMVETAAVGRQSASARGPSEADTREHIQALEAEARSGLVRGGPPSLDRETARALVEAGYLPLPEYLAMYGDTAHRQDATSGGWSHSVAARFAAAPRRRAYRATSVRYTLPKPSDRVFHWRRRA